MKSIKNDLPKNYTLLLSNLYSSLKLRKGYSLAEMLVYKRESAI